MEQESNKISTILKCFVDTNLELNEYYPYRTANLQKVSFTTKGLNVPQNSSFPVSIQLSRPSVNGEEVVVLSLVPKQANNSIQFQYVETITWGIGEQVKNIFITAIGNLTAGLVQGFDLLISSAFNVLPQEGDSSFSINVQGTTILKKASLIQNENSFVLPFWNGLQNQNYLTYEINSLNIPVFKVALNEPSEQGLEEVNLSIFRGVIEPVFVLNKVVKFDIGEQYKEVIIENIPNVVLNNSEVLLAKLLPTTNDIQNLTASINFENGFNEAIIYVDLTNVGAQRKYSTLIFKNILRQKGATINSNPVQLRTINDSQSIPEVTNLENNWLLRFGDIYQDFTDYNDGYPFQETGNYRFGLDVNNQPGELVLMVTNLGDASVEIDGIIYNPGDVYEVAINSSNFQITLPSNAGFSQEPSDFSQFQEFNENGIYTTSVYDFAIKNNGQTYFQSGFPEVFYRHNFTPLDDSGNAGSNVFKLGPFELENFSSLLQSLSSPKFLATSYNNILTRYNGGACTDSFANPDNLFNIRVLGIILLDGSNNVTTYTGAEFMSENQFNPICGEFTTNTDTPKWKGVEFDII